MKERQTEKEESVWHCGGPRCLVSADRTGERKSPVRFRRNFQRLVRAALYFKPEWR